MKKREPRRIPWKGFPYTDKPSYFERQMILGVNTLAADRLSQLIQDRKKGPVFVHGNPNYKVDRVKFRDPHNCGATEEFVL